MREALGVGGYAVVAVGVASFCDGGGRVGGVRNKLLDAVEADVEAAMQDGGGVVGREGGDVGGGAGPGRTPAVRADLVSRQERGGGGGGDGKGGSLGPLGLACTAPLAAAGDGGRLGVDVGVALRAATERRQGAAAAAGASRGGAWVARLGAVGTSAAALAASAASQTATRALSLGVVPISSSQMKTPPRLTKGRETAIVPSGL